jgi:hypothetical protein
MSGRPADLPAAAALGPAGVPTSSPRHADDAGPASFAGYRHLAMRVIDQALRDLSGHGGAPCDRESARTFLAGSPMLHLWCAVADVNPCGVMARDRQAAVNVAPGPSGPRLRQE